MSCVHDYSSLSTLAACARKYKHAYVDRLGGPESPPMRAGTALHEGLHVLYTQGWSKPESLERALETLKASWGDFKLPLGHPKAHLNLGFLESLLRAYVEHRRDHPTVLEDAEVLPMAEQAQVFEWPDAKGDLIRLGGKLDLPVRIGDKLFLVDHKTTGSWITSYWLKQFELGHQLRIYAAMMMQKHGLVFDGGFVNAIHMGPTALAEPEVWAKRTSFFTKLHPVRWTRGHLEETWQWVKGLQASEEVFKKLDIWPQNEKNCSMYGGCEYLEICQEPPVMRQAKARMMGFRVWEPTGVLLSGADSKGR